MNDEITIALNKGKLRLMTLFALLFIIAGVWFVLSPAKLQSAVMPSQIIIRVVGVLAIVFFGFCLVIVFKKMGETKPGLIISKEGITDNSSGLSTGLIPWSVIKGVDSAMVQRQQFILLYVTDGDERIARQPGGIKRQLMRVNKRLYGTPVCVSANTLQVSFPELYQLIKEYFTKYGQPEEEI